MRRTMRDDRAVVRDGNAATPVTICLLSAAACVLLIAGGCIAAGHDGGLFIPLGGLGGRLWTAYWLGVVVWFASAVFAAMRGRWLAVLGSAALVLTTLAPSALVIAGCMNGGCM